MPQLLAEVDLRVRPDHNMFGIVDTAAIEEPDPPLPIEVDQWWSSAPSAVLVESLQRAHDVTLRLESWDGDPPDPEPLGWEVDATVDLYLPSGAVSVDAITAGYLRDVLQLPSPGPYRLRITGRNRERVARAHDTLYETYDIDDPGFAAARDTLAGVEYYLARFWPARS